MDRGACSPWGHKDSDMTGQLKAHTFEFPEYHVAMDLGVKSEPVEVQLHFSRNLCQSHAVTEGETPQLWKRLVVGRETL